jgi:hypothetical protein
MERVRMCWGFIVFSLYLNKNVFALDMFLVVIYEVKGFFFFFFLCFVFTNP